ncbi:hypothetical protein BO99DRAFT_131752 [Aspergillus violaceofuscus CBS 115571]|uniref:Uncharacterized protein n=1 Tax=Aspergillus violaceofuscus (strain CBS 115571) TaxID=1450538 RepID=A0A2V5H6Q7_ASPV1|nr:hypothetical protein BO99DRAFT_131752 [Aspergillus violaceofuscus CBS 115571]
MRGKCRLIPTQGKSHASVMIGHCRVSEQLIQTGARHDASGVFSNPRTPPSTTLTDCSLTYLLLACLLASLLCITQVNHKSTKPACCYCGCSCSTAYFFHSLSFLTFQKLPPPLPTIFQTS